MTLGRLIPCFGYVCVVRLCLTDIDSMSSQDILHRQLIRTGASTDYDDLRIRFPHRPSRCGDGPSHRQPDRFCYVCKYAHCALIQAIYPLIIFTLVALDKTHSIQGARLLRERVATDGRLTLTFDTGRDAEKVTILDLGTHGAVQLSDKKDSLEAADSLDEPPAYKGSDVW